MIREFNKSQVPFPKCRSLNLPNEIDLNIEIGPGVGLHPILFAKDNPQKFLLAIEHTRNKFEKFNRRFSNHSLKNLMPLHENAISVITHLIKENTISNYFLLYPNPNPKELNKRWHAMPFMKQLLSTLKKNGTVTLATNKSFYKDEAIKYYRDIWKLEIISNIELNLNTHKEFQTHFEKKYILRGDTCFQTIFKKI